MAADLDPDPAAPLPIARATARAADQHDIGEGSQRSQSHDEISLPHRESSGTEQHDASLRTAPRVHAPKGGDQLRAGPNLLGADCAHRPDRLDECASRMPVLVGQRAPRRIQLVPTEPVRSPLRLTGHNLEPRVLNGGNMA